MVSAPGEVTDGKWFQRRGQCGATDGTLLCTKAEHDAPRLTFDPGLTGWHEVRVRIYHPRDRTGHAVYVGTSRDRALRKLRPELATEDFETLLLGPRDMTGAQMRISGEGVHCMLDALTFTPCSPPRDLPPDTKEVCGILDFADATDDYLPAEQCAAECVRVHAEAGFTTLFWKAYAVRCDYHTHVGQMRPDTDPSSHSSTTLGRMLQQYDPMAAAIEEARTCGIKLLGWMRISNEVSTANPWGGRHPDTPFHLANPEMRQRRKDGTLTCWLSFAYAEVRQHLCAIAREMLDRGMNGLMIDVLRHPPMARYDKPLVDAYIEQTGENPLEMEGDGTEDWLRFKAGAFTNLLRDIRAMMRDSPHRDKPIYVRTMPQPWRNLRDGCDVDAWLQEGLVDTVVLGHHCITSPGHPLHLDMQPMADLIAGRARTIVQVMRGCEVPTALELARQAYIMDVDGVAVYESNDAVTYPGTRDAMRFLRTWMKATNAHHTNQRL